MKEDRLFLDTNVIVYAYDTSAKEKHEKALKIMMDFWESGLGVLSTQVIQEFYVTVTRKIPKPMEQTMARDIVADLLASGEHQCDLYLAFGIGGL